MKKLLVSLLAAILGSSVLFPTAIAAPTDSAAPVSPTALSATEPTYDDARSIVIIPDVAGVTYTVDGVEAPAGEFPVTPSERGGIKVTIIAKRTSDGAEQSWTHEFPFQLTPTAATFRDADYSIKAGSHWGVTYWLIAPDGTETKLISNSYKLVPEFEGQTVTVEARSNNTRAVNLNGVTSWQHTFPATGKEPGWDHSNSTVNIPNIKGITYTVDGVEAPAGPFTVSTSPDQSIEVTVVATRTSDNTQWKWTHTFPRVLTPDAPTFDDNKLTIKTPSHWGVTYWLITPDGTETKLNSNSYVPVSEYKGQTVTIEARPNSAAKLLTGTTSWTHTFPAKPAEPEWNDETSTIVIPDVPGVTYTVDGTEVPPGDFKVTTNPKTATTVTVVATRDSDGQQTTWTHSFPDVLTPDAPTFDDNKLTIKTPSHWGVTYWLITPDGTETKLNSNSYTTIPEYEGQTIRVEARPNSAAKLLTGTTSWTHTFPRKPAAPTVDKPTSTIIIPTVPGVEYRIDGKTVTGKQKIDTSKGRKIVTVTAVQTATGVESSWELSVPQVVTPGEPKYNDVKHIVWVPGILHVNYWAVNEATGEEFKLKPNSWTGSWEQFNDKTFRIEARANNDNVYLVGTTSWKHIFWNRPADDLSDGDEFNSERISKDWNIHAQTTKSRSTSRAENISIVKLPDGTSALQLTTMRHCLRPGEEANDANAQLDGAVCPRGTSTAYSSAQMDSPYAIGIPRTFEARVRLDSPHKGITTTTWMHNDAGYCQWKSATPENKDTGELDLVEVWGTKQAVMSTFAGCWHDEDGVRHYASSKPRIDVDLPGKWHTFRMEYDGRSIRYMVDGRPVTEKVGEEIVAESFGITGTKGDGSVSQAKFDSVMQNHKWRIVAGTKVARLDGWAPFIRDDEVFKPQHDLIDYIRVQQWQPTDIPTITASSDAGGLVQGSTNAPGRTVRAEVQMPDKTWRLVGSTTADAKGNYVLRIDEGAPGKTQYRISVTSRQGFWKSTLVDVERALTAHTANTKQIGQTTYVWGTTNTPGATVFTEAKLPNGKWSRSQTRTVQTNGSYVIPLTYGSNSLGTTVYRVGLQTPDGVIYSDEVSLYRIPSIETAGTKIIGATTYAWGDTGLANARVFTEVLLPNGKWSVSQVRRTQSSGKFVLPLTYGQNVVGRYRYRVGVQTSAGVVYYSPSTFLTRTPSASTAGTKPVNQVTNVWGNTGVSGVTVFTEVQLPSGAWSRSQTRTANSSGFYAVPLTYGSNKLGTTRYRVAVVTPTGVVRSPSVTITRTR